MSNSINSSSKLHIAMFSWFEVGHFIPFLSLSNKLAEKGHKISFLLPQGAQPKLEPISQYPNLIQFFPLVVSNVDGLPPGSATGFIVPEPQHLSLAFTAFDQTQDQVKTILEAIKPDLVVYDLGYWVPALARQLGIKSIYYCVFSAAASAQIPSVTHPSSAVKLKPEEVAMLKPMIELLSSFQGRLVTSMEESDAMAFRTCREIEGSFCDYVAQQFGKSVLLTGHALSETQSSQLEEKLANWLSQFEPRSVVFCALGSVSLRKDEFQELLLGFELCELPFLLSLKPPKGCNTIEDALPEGFQERVRERGLVHGGRIPQGLLSKHPSVGCLVNHCPYGKMWESLLSDCQIVLIPHLIDEILNTRLMVEELKVAVEVERGANRKISKENLSKAIKLVMDKDSEMAALLKHNHTKLKLILSNEVLQQEYINNFIQALQDLVSNAQYKLQQQQQDMNQSKLVISQV